MTVLENPHLKLKELINLPAETEWIEFKEAKNNFDFDDFEQKRNFVTNLLQEMRRERIIQPVKGKRVRGAEWELYNDPSKDPV